MSLSVIICTCSMSRYDTLLTLLERLADQTYKNLEAIVVVDENRSLFNLLSLHVSSDHTLDFVKTIYNPCDKGLSNARNIGIASASRDLIAFIDDDAYPDPCWAELIVSDFRENTSVGAIIGDVFPDWDRKGMDWFPRELFWMISCSYTQTPTTKQYAERGFGVCMAFRKELVESAGMFDTRLGMQGKKWVGGEDTDMFLKVHCLGKKVLFDPGIIVYHKVYPNRISPGAIINRAFGGGYSVSILKRRKRYRMSGSMENRYLHTLLFQFYPGAIRSFLRTFSLNVVKQMSYVSIVIFFEMIGYVYGLANRVYINHDPEKLSSVAILTSPQDT